MTYDHLEPRWFKNHRTDHDKIFCHGTDEVIPVRNTYDLISSFTISLHLHVVNDVVTAVCRLPRRADTRRRLVITDY